MVVRVSPMIVVLALLTPSASAPAQTPPSAVELSAYGGLHAAAAQGNEGEVGRLLGTGTDANARDPNGRTPLHVAAFQGHPAVARVLIQAGADPSLLDHQRYDAVTVAAVRDDIATVQALLDAGASARLVTSPYDGTALIAAAHLGHDDVVRSLIRAGAPLDHVNNLGWTALIEAVILGNGGPRHTRTVRALVEAGADVNIADREGRTPLQHARARGYAGMMQILEQAGGR